MQKRIVFGFAVAAALAFGDRGRADTVFSKPPDLGPYWNPLTPNGFGSWVYADSFVAPAGETTPSRLGTWLVNTSLPGLAPTIRFEIWGTTAAGGPDGLNVLARTASLGPFDETFLYHDGAAIGTPAALTAGTRYWFVATAVGEHGRGQYQVGAHTQNSTNHDDGTFWWSNSPVGLVFDGQNRTPEMAYQIVFSPEPGTLALLAIGCLALRRK